MTGLLTAWLLAQDPDVRFIKAFDLFPPISESAPISQADADSYKAKSLAKVYRADTLGEAFLDNGVARLAVTIQPFGRAKFFSIRSTSKTVSDLPMPTIKINGRDCALGSPGNPLRPMAVQGTLFAKPFDVRDIPGASFIWPPRGMGMKFLWNHPEFPDLIVELRYQMVDREPTVNQTITIRNGSPYAISIDHLDEGGQWPEPTFKGASLHWVIRPGRVVELPEAWFSLNAQGQWVNATRQRTATELSPWEALRTKTLEQWPPNEAEIKQAARAGFHAVLIPNSAEISWSALAPEELQAVADFVALAKKSRLAAGAEVELSGIPADAADRTIGPASPVCWLSFAGSHWRQSALQNWRRHGIQAVQLSGPLPESCDKTGHAEHQGSIQGRIENALATRDFLRAGLVLGIVIRHPLAKAYGPANVY